MTRRNPTGPRLLYIARTYHPIVAYEVALGWAEAMGLHGLKSEIIHTYDALDSTTSRFIEREGAKGGPSKNMMASTLEKLLRSYGAYDEHTRYDRYLPAFARMFNKEVKAYVSAKTKSRQRDAREEVFLNADILEAELRPMVDWVAAHNEDLNLPSSNLRDVSANALAWDRPDAAITPLVDGEIVYRFSDGWTVQELTTQEQIDGEGCHMQHCLDTYQANDIGVVYRIYSLRDPGSTPHATMEWNVDQGYVEQLRGKANSIPKRDYLRRMAEFRTDYLKDIVPGVPGLDAVPRAQWPEFADAFSVKLLGVWQDKDPHYLDRGEGATAAYRKALLEKENVGAISAIHEPELFAVYADGTILDVGAIEEYVEDLRNGVDGITDDADAHQWMLEYLDEVPPTAVSELYSPPDRGPDIDGLHWLVWQATGAALSSSPDEMVRHLARLDATERPHLDQRSSGDRLHAQIVAEKAKTNPRSPLGRHAELKRRLMR